MGVNTFPNKVQTKNHLYLIIKKNKMSNCCGQSKSVITISSKKLGTCKFCIALSLGGSLVSYCLAAILIGLNRFHFGVTLFSIILAIGFTSLSILHVIYYYKKSKIRKVVKML
jgi:hypothetical protein